MIKIKKRVISNSKPCFVIAEVGLAHEGSVGIAKSFIDLISDAKADAVKFQMHIPEEESSYLEKFRKKFSTQDRSRWDYWKRTSFTISQWIELKKYSEKKGLIFLCSPFSLKAVDILNKMKIDAWKIASGEFTNLLMIDKIIRSSTKPLILSTGLSDEKEVGILMTEVNKKNICLLQCTSQYPANLENAGHNYIDLLKKKYKCVAGISDHTGNINSLIAAVSMGANILEAHVTFHPKFFGPDTTSSINFQELKFLCNYTRDFNLIKNSNYSKKKKTIVQKKLIKLFTKSLVLKNNKTKGDKIYIHDLESKKPRVGIDAMFYKKIIGKKVAKNLTKGVFLKKSDFI